MSFSEREAANLYGASFIKNVRKCRVPTNLKSIELSRQHTQTLQGKLPEGHLEVLSTSIIGTHTLRSNF